MEHANTLIAQVETLPDTLRRLEEALLRRPKSLEDLNRLQERLESAVTIAEDLDLELSLLRQKLDQCRTQLANDEQQLDLDLAAASTEGLSPEDEMAMRNARVPLDPRASEGRINLPFVPRHARAQDAPRPMDPA